MSTGLSVSKDGGLSNPWLAFGSCMLPRGPRNTVAFPHVRALARGVTVARLTLDQLVLVRIQAGQHSNAAGRARFPRPTRRWPASRSLLRSTVINRRWGSLVP